MRTDQQCRWGLIPSVVCLMVSMVISIYAGFYASEKASYSHYVGDLLLDNIPRYDVSILHTYIASFFWIFLIACLIKQSNKLAFAFITASLFLIVRSAFVVMTHLGAPDNMLAQPPWPASLYIHQGDLFFSGHAGAPFLFALIYWDQPWIRNSCLLAAFIFGVIVLVGGIHYSIDVFAAFFFAHSIYHLSCKYCLINKSSH